MASGVEDRDLGYADIVKAIRAMGKSAGFNVGIQGAEASRLRKGATNAEIGTWQEFGTSKIPERSFMRSTFDEKRRRYDRQIESAIANARNPQQLKGELRLTAETYRADVIDKIRSGIPPPLEPGTIAGRGAEAGAAREGTSTPLINTGQLINSLSVVERKQ